MAAPQITLYTGDVPNRATDSATEFANNADDMVNYIAIIPDEYNELGDFVNSAAETAQASASFAGNWSSLSGAYNAGTGVYHDGITWLLLVNLSSIQSSEPSGSNSDWLALASLTQQSTNTANIATNANDISEIKNDDISIGGVKTFIESPIVPTPTTDTQAANKAYTDSRNGLAGNYEVILDFGAYSSGAYTYPNGHTQDDYDLIVFVASSYSASGQSSGNVGIVTKEQIENFPTSWVSRVQSASGEYVQADYTSTTSLTISNSGDDLIRTVIGYLKEGV